MYSIFRSHICAHPLCSAKHRSMMIVLKSAMQFAALISSKKTKTSASDPCSMKLKRGRIQWIYEKPIQSMVPSSGVCVHHHFYFYGFQYVGIVVIIGWLVLNS